MKVTKIKYEKLVNLGNYEHEKMGIEIELDEKDSPHKAIKRAKAFLEKELNSHRPTDEQYMNAQRVINDYEIDEIPF